MDIMMNAILSIKLLHNNKYINNDIIFIKLIIFVIILFWSLIGKIRKFDIMIKLSISYLFIFIYKCNAIDSLHLA